VTLMVWLQAGVVASGLVSLACAIFVAQRAGRWRESDEAKLLTGRITMLETKVTAIEGKLDFMATKGDLQSLASEVRAIGREVGKVEDGVKRIESWLMEREK